MDDLSGVALVFKPAFLCRRNLDGYPIPDDNRYRIGDYVTASGLLVSYVNITSARVDHGGNYDRNHDLKFSS